MKMRIVFPSLLTILCLVLSAASFAGVIYSNGPTNGTKNAYYIDGPGGQVPQTISDGFVAAASGTASSFDFAEWTPIGSNPISVAWSLGTSSFGSQISSGSTDAVGFTFLFNNDFGYSVYTSHVSGISGDLTAGNIYWLTLTNADDSQSTGSDAWDENDGPAKCYFDQPGLGRGPCSEQNGGSNSFTINGAVATPEPGGIMLLGSGILGLAGVLRRKTNR